jgi:hypothetical protein
VAALPELQRQVFVRTTLDGASHEEVATALGLTSGAVRGLIYRARAALRSAAAAVVPTPVLSWAVRHAATRSRRAHVIEAALGGGGAGVAGLIAKGGALIAITGAVAGGGIIVSHATPNHHRKSTQAALHRTNGSSISATLLAPRPQGAAPRSTRSNAHTAASGAARSNDMRGGSSGSAGGSSGPSTSGHDGGSRGGSSGGSDGDSSFATTAQSSRGPGGSSSDGGASGTSGGQITTAMTTSGGSSGTDGGSSGSSGGGTTTTTGTH